jgi:hypothetical protein
MPNDFQRKYFFRILALLALWLCFASEVKAQEWEQVGWNGGTYFRNPVRLGNSLFCSSDNCVYKSNDWGKTWIPFRNGLPMNSNFFHSCIFFQRDAYLFIDNYREYNSIDSNILETGIYYCKEHDTIWSFKKISKIKGYAARILFWSSDTVCAYRQKNNIGVDSLDGFYFSSDNGISWQRRVPDSLINQNSFGFSMRSYFFLYSSNTLYKTIDFGKTWKELLLPHGGGGNIIPVSDDQLLQQLFTSPDFDTLDVLQTSNDFGETWQSAGFTHPDTQYVEGLIFWQSIESRLYVCPRFYPDRRNHIYYISKYQPGISHEIDFRDSAFTVWSIFGKENHYILNTSNGLFTTDSNFSQFTPLLPTGLYLNSAQLLCLIGTKLYATNNELLNDSLLVSVDNGKNWTKKIFSSENKLYNQKWIINENNLYALGIQKDSLPCIFRSTDEGDTWNIAVVLPSKDGVQKFFIQRDTVIVVREKDFMISIDKGKSWIVIDSHNISSDSHLDYRDGVFVIASPDNVFLPNDFYLTSSIDFGRTWKIDQILNSAGYTGPYIFGGKWFVGKSIRKKNQTYSYPLYFRYSSDTNFYPCKGLSSNLIFVPSVSENSILFALGFSTGIYPAGFSTLEFSLDSGSNWNRLGNNVTNSTDVFIGSEYIFLAGPNELWRMPKSVLNTLKAPEQKNISPLSISCAPNPVSTSTRISYSLPIHCEVLLQAFDLMGRETQRITSGTQDAGEHDVVWDTQPLPSGSYIIRLSAGGQSAARVVEVVK